METVSWRAWGAGLQEGGARGRTARARPHVRHPHAESPGRPSPALLGCSSPWPRDDKSPPSTGPRSAEDSGHTAGFDPLLGSRDRPRRSSPRPSLHPCPPSLIGSHCGPSAPWLGRSRAAQAFPDPSQNSPLDSPERVRASFPVAAAGLTQKLWASVPQGPSCGSQEHPSPHQRPGARSLSDRKDPNSKTPKE